MAGEIPVDGRRGAHGVSTALTEVTDAYAARSSEYEAAFGSLKSVAPQDRDDVNAWAHGVSGPILDVGCGPGQWTDYLDRQGLDVRGMDPTVEFVASAQRRFPTSHFQVGRAEQLPVPDAVLGGVLAWYSIIHTEPQFIGSVLTEFARALRPGGSVALGSFTGSVLEPFEHAVTTAYYWPMDLMASHLRDHGFSVTAAYTRTDPGVRAHGLITAVRLARGLAECV